MTMRSTHGTYGEKVQRILTAFSCSPEEDRRRDGLLRTAFCLVTDGFSCQPEPKSTWYETRQGDLTPWKQVVHPIRSALVAAYQSGDRELIAKTLENARAFCRELEADFTSIVPTEQEESIIALALEETKHQGPADEASMALAANPACPTAAERAILPLQRHYNRLGTLLERCRRHARKARPSSMAVIR